MSSLIQQKKPASAPAAPVGSMASAESSAGHESRVWHIPVSLIRPNPHQPRKQFNHQDLEDLMSSIKEHGVIQPILVTEDTDGHYELIAGERRYRSATMLGLPTIPAMVRKATEHEKLELALIENVQRSQLNPLEEAFAYQRLIDEFGLTQEEVARQIGRSRSVVANTVRLLQLPQVVQEALAEGKIAAGAARALLGLPDEKSIIAQFHALLGTGKPVREVEHSVREEKNKRHMGGASSAQTLADEARLREALGTKVKITERNGQGSITIHYYAPEERMRLMKHLARH